MSGKRSLLFDVVILSSWWVILFLLALFFIYDQALHKKKSEERALRAKYEQLVLQRDETLDHVEDLTLRKKSLGEREWIEMTLKEKLGLVGEGQTKVLFR